MSAQRCILWPATPRNYVHKRTKQTSTHLKLLWTVGAQSIAEKGESSLKAVEPTWVRSEESVHWQLQKRRQMTLRRSDERGLIRRCSRQQYHRARVNPPEQSSIKPIDVQVLSRIPPARAVLVYYELYTATSHYSARNKLEESVPETVLDAQTLSRRCLE